MRPIIGGGGGGADVTASVTASSNWLCVIPVPLVSSSLYNVSISLEDRPESLSASSNSVWLMTPSPSASMALKILSATDVSVEADSVSESVDSDDSLDPVSFRLNKYAIIDGFNALLSVRDPSSVESVGAAPFGGGPEGAALSSGCPDIAACLRCMIVAWYADELVVDTEVMEDPFVKVEAFCIPPHSFALTI
ncbi:MAG: hypothetical protein PHE27_07685 [Alphaproteobacteria bacterium]|nr:hypothetical protein [Alphaproteobacteria bacterium]